jgi:transposase
VKTAGLNTLTWLTAYLGECGRNGGKPLTGEALDRFLPWTASPEDLRAWPSLRHRIKTRVR